MTIPALSIAIAVVLLAAAFAFVFYRLASRMDPNTGAAEWLDTFSLESYAPMRRLLDQSDFEFLRKQPGYHPALEKHLHTARRAAFIDYLWMMTASLIVSRIGRMMLVKSKIRR